MSNVKHICDKYCRCFSTCAKYLRTCSNKPFPNSRLGWAQTTPRTRIARLISKGEFSSIPWRRQRCLGLGSEWFWTQQGPTSQNRFKMLGALAGLNWFDTTAPGWVLSILLGFELDALSRCYVSQMDALLLKNRHVWRHMSNSGQATRCHNGILKKRSSKFQKQGN